jgi:hypothetical protein
MNIDCLDEDLQSKKSHNFAKKSTCPTDSICIKSENQQEKNLTKSKCEKKRTANALNSNEIFLNEFDSQTRSASEYIDLFIKHSKDSYSSLMSSSIETKFKEFESKNISSAPNSWENPSNWHLRILVKFGVLT